MTSDKKSVFPKPRPDMARLAFLFLLVGALLSILWSVAFAVVTISIPYQIELREGAAQVVTRILLNRENPYTFEYQPLAINIYGVMYNLSVLPFAALFGNTLLVHRAVTFAFIVLSAMLIFGVAYKTGRDAAFGLTAAAFVMIALISRAGIGAFSSAMGTFLFLAAALLPFLRSFDKASLLSSAFLALAAFYTKPYFVLVFGIVASFLFLFVSKRTGILYALFFILLLAVSFAPVKSLFPLYFFNSIIVNMSMSWMSYAHMWAQLSSLFFSFLPILALSALFIGMSLANGMQRREKFIDLFAWRRPLLDYAFDYLMYLFVICLLAFIFILGRHLGNDMNYAHQLLVTTFAAWFAGRVRFEKKFAVLSAILVLFNLFFWQGGLLSPRMLEQKDSAEWARLFSYVHSSSNILNSQVEASEVVRLGLIPVDTGQTMVYYLVKPFPSNLLVDASYEAVAADGVMYANSIDQSIQKQRFDTVISVKEKGAFYHTKRLGDYYVLVDEIQVKMPQALQQWTVLVWKPKPK